MFFLSFTFSDAGEANAIRLLHTHCVTGLLSVRVRGIHSFTVGEDRNFEALSLVCRYVSQDRLLLKEKKRFGGGDFH